MARAAVAAAAAAWLVATGAGFGRLWLYAYTPGPAATAPSTWPSTSLPRDPARPTLVMILHPECSCSRASLEELARVVAHTRTRASVLVLFAVPATLSLAPDNPLWAEASAIPGVRTVVDAGGREAARFGATVSGQAFLYDAEGRLRFSGGLTAARAHAGDNDGEAAVRAFVLTGRAPIDAAPSFGCPLREKAQP